jgi:hypothetical protein
VYQVSKAKQNKFGEFKEKNCFKDYKPGSIYSFDWIEQSIKQQTLLNPAQFLIANIGFPEPFGHDGGRK